MGYSCYYSVKNDRHQGYGVSAYCDHPGCYAQIDRGMGHACCDEPDSEVGCGGMYCSDHKHMSMMVGDLGDLSEKELRELGLDGPEYPVVIDSDGEIENSHEYVKCFHEPIESKEHPDWAKHVATDESWENWRTENSEKFAVLQKNAAENAENAKLWQNYNDFVPVRRVQDLSELADRTLIYYKDSDGEILKDALKFQSNDFIKNLFDENKLYLEWMPAPEKEFEPFLVELPALFMNPECTHGISLDDRKQAILAHLSAQSLPGYYAPASGVAYPDPEEMAYIVKSFDPVKLTYMIKWCSPLHVPGGCCVAISCIAIGTPGAKYLECLRHAYLIHGDTAVPYGEEHKYSEPELDKWKNNILEVGVVADGA